jgi:SAM-dependent methyltransferase
MEKGCDVTLIDLSDANVAFAKERADEKGLPLKAICGDACVADTLVNGQFNHILLMGPLYHLPEEADRQKCVNAAINLLKTDGFLYSAFISSYAAMWDFMASDPKHITENKTNKFYELVTEDKDFSGIGFTSNFFIAPKNLNLFMEQFPLEKLHIVGCESILSLREQELRQEHPDVFQKWIELALMLCEREDFLSMAQHLLHIGRKIG